MQQAAGYYRQYAGGYFAFKRILRYREDGSKVISREATGWKHFGDDYVSSAYLNANGLRVAYCIPFDIDSKDTDKKWLDLDGAIDWERALAFLQKTYPEIFKYTLFVVRSTGGKGIHLGLAISPIVKDGTAGTDKTLFLAKQAQIQIMRLMRHHGFGADYSAGGVIRDLPNWRRKQASKNSKAKQLYFNQPIRAQIKRESLPVISELLEITNKLKECKPQAKKDMSEILHTNKTTESRLAPLYIELFENMGQSSCFTMKELVELTGISKDTLRNLLVRRPKSRPKWLNASYISKSEGYELWINPEHGCIERAMKLVVAPETQSNFIPNLMCPTEVEDGGRNAWISSAAIQYKWHGYSKHETMAELDRQAKLIPNYRNSTSFRNIPQIVSSIFENYPELRGIRADMEVPAVLSAEYFQKLKKLQKAPLGVSLPCMFVGFTRKKNQKYVVGYLDGKVLGATQVKGNGYVYQLRGIKELLGRLDKKPHEVVVRGNSMLLENPVVDKFAVFHGFCFKFEDRDLEDKKLLREFRESERPVLNICPKISNRETKALDITCDLLAFSFPEMTVKRVRFDGYVNYLTGFYWLGESWKGRRLQVVEEDGKVEFYYKSQFVISHQKIADKNGKTEGLDGPWRKALGSDSHYRLRAQKVGPAFDSLICLQIERGQGVIHIGKLMGFLSLMKSWPLEQLEAVATHCLKVGNTSQRYFRSCLDVGHE